MSKKQKEASQLFDSLIFHYTKIQSTKPLFFASISPLETQLNVFEPANFRRPAEFTYPLTRNFPFVKQYLPYRPDVVGELFKSYDPRNCGPRVIPIRHIDRRLSISKIFSILTSI